MHVTVSRAVWFRGDTEKKDLGALGCKQVRREPIPQAPGQISAAVTQGAVLTLSAGVTWQRHCVRNAESQALPGLPNENLYFHEITGGHVYRRLEEQ